MKTVLTIAGYDPSSGAGITADLMVFAAHGLFGTSCITSLTVQSTLGVVSSHPVEPGMLQKTLECLTNDLPPVGIKIGMLGAAASVLIVADFLERMRVDNPEIPIVLDPVLSSSSGRELLEPAGVKILRARLLPLVDWITPNIDELGLLAELPVKTREDLPAAAMALQFIGGDGLSILATGGHLEPPDDLLLLRGGELSWLPGKRIVSNSTHGTGCAMSSALLSQLVLGRMPHPAALAAKEYVARAIRSALPMGGGKGPLNHLWPLKSPE